MISILLEEVVVLLQLVLKIILKILDSNTHMHFVFPILFLYFQVILVVVVVTVYYY